MLNITIFENDRQCIAHSGFPWTTENIRRTLTITLSLRTDPLLCYIKVFLSAGFISLNQIELGVTPGHFRSQVRYSKFENKHLEVNVLYNL